MSFLNILHSATCSSNQFRLHSCQCRPFSLARSDTSLCREQGALVCLTEVLSSPWSLHIHTPGGRWVQLSPEPHKAFPSHSSSTPSSFSRARAFGPARHWLVGCFAPSGIMAAWSHIIQQRQIPAGNDCILC